jgi:hypothetical protein
MAVGRFLSLLGADSAIDRIGKPFYFGPSFVFGSNFAKAEDASQCNWTPGNSLSTAAFDLGTLAK